MANVNPPRKCNPLCTVGRLSGGSGGGLPCVGATLCTFPAFSLVPKMLKVARDGNADKMILGVLCVFVVVV